MNLQQHFKEHESKFRFEALLKALLFGIVLGSVVGFITATLTWFLVFEVGLWISIGLAVLISALSTWILYAKVYKPNVADNARRLDRYGLDERLITMVEYQNDNSYMAAIQREDAARQLNKIKSQDVRIKISPKYIIWSSICFVLCAGMCVVHALSAAGIIPSADDLIESLTPEEPDIYISVIYDVEEGGYIDGESDQLVLKGTDTEPVLAVADDGYVFVEWSDGLTDPYRYDRNVVEELEIFATFEQTGEENGGEAEDEGEGEESDEQEPSEQEGKGEPTDQPSDSDESQETETDAKYNEANQIIDGETYYREIIEDYKEALIEYLETHRGELSEEEIAIIESYIGIV